MKIRNIFGTVFSGKLGHDMIAATWHGHDYIRAYRAPSGAPSPLQREQRTTYGKSVGAWRALCDRQRELYRRLAEGMTGYNLFMQRCMDALDAGKTPEVPIPLTYVTADGKPIAGADLVVRTKDRTLFTDGLEDGRGEIALTHADAPYTFVLRKGTQEEVVRTIDDLLETDVPAVLESATLGIRLVLDVAKPGAAGPPRTGA